ncbi:MAG TPA: multicopper oxidase domain-containing protein [Bacteroidia bacterium]|jgi:FtsP/CotA-like multicopper oxidase with cupredoxin domain
MKKTKHISLFLCAFFVLMFTNVRANRVADTLYINSDTLTKGFQFIHFCGFNNSPVFSEINAKLYVQTGDTLDLTIVNNDTLIHDLTVDNQLTSGNTIAPSDTAIFSLSFNSEGTYRFYSSYAYGQLQGASGMILVGYPGKKHFFWNLFDQDSLYSKNVSLGLQTGFSSTYKPGIFTINSFSYPQTSMDKFGNVMANVGDSIIISIVNSGHMISTLHMHGYHFKIIQTTKDLQKLNWVKDSAPLVPYEAMTILVVPDKPGEYPVHNHNLISNTNYGIYPGGMMTHLMIDP